MLLRETAGDDDQIRIDDFPYGLITYDEDEQFIPTLQAIAERRANIDHLLIETSGLALPTAVMEVLQSPELSEDYILDATLAVVDTPLLLEQQFEASAGSQVAVSILFEQQLEFADVVVLNKIDDIDEQDLLQAKRLVREKAPNVRFLELAFNARLDIQLALGLRLHQVTEPTSYQPINPTFSPIPNADSKVPANQRPFDGHAHSGLAAHSHGLATHKHFHEQDPGWLSFVQQFEVLKAALMEVAKQEPVLRCKGFVYTEHMLLAQGVRTRLELSLEEQQTTSQKSEMVFIGYYLSRGKVSELLSTMTQSEWK